MEGTRDRILSTSLGALFVFLFLALFFPHFAPCGCLSLASRYFVHILTSKSLREEEKKKKREERKKKGRGVIGRALNISLDVQQPLHQVHRTFVCISNMTGKTIFSS